MKVKRGAFGYISESERIDESLNPKVNWYDCPVFETSLELSTILKEPFVFFVIVAKPEGGSVFPDEVSVPTIVSGKISEETTHAGIVSSVISEMK